MSRGQPVANTESSQTAPLASRTRAQILTYLASVGVVADPSGHANRKLRDALGFSGSTGAFTQMLAAMDQGQLIERQVKGRRTYTIRLGAAAGVRNPAPAAQAQTVVGEHDPLSATVSRETSPPWFRGEAAASGGADGSGTQAQSAIREVENGLDYDELATSLLRAVARTLGNRAAGDDRSGGAGGAGMAQRRIVNLERTVVSLEKELAKVRAEKSELLERNNQLQAQVAAAEHNLEVLGQRGGRRRPDARARLDDEEAQLLRRLTRKLPDGEAATSAPASSAGPASPGPATPGGVPGWPRRV